MEHLVDVVLMFEGDRQHLFRMLRGIKNRFGPTSELGVFAMGQAGLEAVADPSRALLAERPTDAAGSVVAAVLEGSRPLLVEIQALVAPSYGMPRRVVTGLDAHRVALALAVLERHAGARLGDRDVFVKVTGGVEVDDPAVDLAVVAAVASSLAGQAVPEGSVLVGEVGLTGEIRSAPRIAERLKEAAQLGFHHSLAPNAVEGYRVETVKTVAAALVALGLRPD